MSPEHHVHLGTWTNWSRGSSTIGATLTTTRAQGDLLIAFTALLIPFVASRFWRISCLLIHRCCSTDKAREAVHHQRQVLLRNSSTPGSGLISAIQLAWAWRRSKSGYFTKILPIIIFAILTTTTFTVAGGFSSLISTAAGDEVLLKGDNCAVLEVDSGTNISTVSALASEVAARVNDAANYAQQCYATQDSGILGCDRFVSKHLPTADSDNNASCPFSDQICQTQNANIRLDTGYIDSNIDLGLNAPTNAGFKWRYVLQCAPLTTKGFKRTMFSSADNRTWVLYNYGSYLNGDFNNETHMNYTYLIPDVDSQYRIILPSSATGNFKLSSYPTYMSGAEIIPSLSAFSPIPDLITIEGDITLVFLSGNGVLFSQEMDDDWYRASTPSETISESGLSGMMQGYRSDEAASPLGCVEQWQWCNSAYPTDAGCGPLASYLDAFYGAAPLFNLSAKDLAVDVTTSRPGSPTEVGARLLWPLSMQADRFHLHTILAHLGERSLASRSLLLSGVQYPLPRDQWKRDVTNWWQIILASVQDTVVNTAIGTSNPALRGAQIKPANAYEKSLCNSQKIRSNSYASFNLFGLLFTYTTGSIIVVISFLLEPILHYLSRSRKVKRYQSLEWIANGSMQLHRQTQEELDFGNWTRCTDTIPITKPGENLASLKIEDPEHPVLCRHDDDFTTETKAYTLASPTSIDLNIV